MSSAAFFSAKIRELAEFPDVLLTHTDAADVYVWNIENQPAR